MHAGREDQRNNREKAKTRTKTAKTETPVNSPTKLALPKPLDTPVAG